MKELKNIFIGISIVFLFGCEKEELPIAINYPEIFSTQISLESDYRNQVFYNISSDLITSQNIKTDWDICFENSLEGYHVMINSSTFSSVASLENIGFTDLNSISPNSLTWKWDNPNGDLDSLAIGDYRLEDKIYILDRGYNIDGSFRSPRYKKFIIDTVTDMYYIIRYANIDNSDMLVKQINKDYTTNMIRYSFASDMTFSLEPNKADWNLLFTQYTAFFSDTTTPAYLVTGVLLNTINGTEAALDSINSFNEITFSNINDYSFSKKQDFIGYNWKEYSLSNQIYTINSNSNYIIKTAENRYFKLRFLDFYNSIGEKGHPTFEAKELINF